MSKQLFIGLCLTAAAVCACKKDPPVPVSKMPVANAGADIFLVPPTDSVTLDGSASSDPDGKLEAYSWTQVSGPSVAEVLTPQVAKTKARRLQPGTYLFELTVKDNSGLSAKDTVLVRLAPPARISANAGSDQAIDLTLGSVTLDGTASVDSTGLVLSHQWRQLSGPATQVINGNSAVATVRFSAADIYRFELRVWNGNGEAYDTTSVTVKDCAVSRTELTAQLTHLKQFSFSQYNTARLLAVGNKLLIPVDVYDPIAGSYVFVYDVSTGTYTLRELNFPRFGAATVVAGNKVFFAGGFTDFNDDERPGVTDEVSIYDAATNTWSTAKLSEARGAVKAGVAGNKVVFAGGLKSNLLSKRVDVYDLQTGQWTTTQLAGEPRAVERVVADGANVYFLGGYTLWDNVTGFGFILTGASRTIDVYNAGSGNFSTATMQAERYGFSAVLVDNKILIAGGVTGVGANENITSNVELITLPTMARTNTCLAAATVWYGSDATAIKNGSVIFYLSDQGFEKRKFNIYNPQTGAWSLGVHQFDVLGQGESAALATVNNQVYVLKGNTLFKLDY